MGAGVVAGLGQLPSWATFQQSLASGRQRCAEPSGCQRRGGRWLPSGPRALRASGQVPLPFAGGLSPWTCLWAWSHRHHCCCLWGREASLSQEDPRPG